MKHTEIGYHFIRGIVGVGKIMLKKVDTLNNPYDILIKPLTVGKFEYFSYLIGVHRL